MKFIIASIVLLLGCAPLMAQTRAPSPGTTAVLEALQRRAAQERAAERERTEDGTPTVRDILAQAYEDAEIARSGVSFEDDLAETEARVEELAAWMRERLEARRAAATARADAAPEDAPEDAPGESAPTPEAVDDPAPEPLLISPPSDRAGPLEDQGDALRVALQERFEVLRSELREWRRACERLNDAWAGYLDAQERLAAGRHQGGPAAR